jgi:hypothetical protein
MVPLNTVWLGHAWIRAVGMEMKKDNSISGIEYD